MAQGERIGEEGSERRAEILEAAFEEFAAKGFRGATIKSIAAEAGLQSPALIYWYFSNKEELFREVVGSRIVGSPLLRAVSEPEEMMELPPREALTRVGRAYFAFRRMDGRIIRLLLGEVFKRREIGEAFIEVGPGRVIGVLKSYLDLQVEIGRLRPHDTRSSARSFIGMLLPQLAGQVFFPKLLEDGLTDEEHLKTSVEIFVRGLEREEE